LECSFCDTRSYAGAERLSAREVLKRVLALRLPGFKNTAVLTGGEPLLRGVFLKELLPLLASENLTVYLETNGTLAKALESVISYIDIISMDIKLPSVCNIRPCWQDHRIFLTRAAGKELFIKIIVSDKIDIQEFDRALALVKETSRDVPVIIQPETSRERTGVNISADTLLGLQKKALSVFSKVLVIPQSHKMMGLR
jgi:organic radical activating enzyme